jgi:hypothetical protein
LIKSPTVQKAQSIAEEAAMPLSQHETINPNTDWDQPSKQEKLICPEKELDNRHADGPLASAEFHTTTTPVPRWLHRTLTAAMGLGLFLLACSGTFALTISTASV